MNQKLLDVLKSRRRILRSAVKENENILQRNTHKSRRVRAKAFAGPRKSFFTDRLQELELTIGYLEGKIEKKAYLDAQVNQQL